MPIYTLQSGKSNAGYLNIWQDQNGVNHVQKSEDKTHWHDVNGGTVSGNANSPQNGDTLYLGTHHVNGHHFSGNGSYASAGQKGPGYYASSGDKATIADWDAVDNSGTR